MLGRSPEQGLSQLSSGELPASRVTGMEALKGHPLLQVRSQDPLRTPSVRGTPSPRLPLILRWRLQEAERPRQVSEARMKGIFTAAGRLISFGTEITTPSLIRGQELLLHPLGRRAGGCPLGCPRLLRSHGAAHSRPKQGAFTKVKSATRVLQRGTLTRRGRQE